MPYITPQAKDRMNDGLMPTGAGELNYKITKVVDDYLWYCGGASYNRINEVIGALECAKLELYRRIAAPYEDKKLKANGDAYRTEHIA